MKLHVYTNNAYDTVALINDADQVISYWDETAIESAISTDDVSEWEDQGHKIDEDEFAAGNDLFLVVHENGDWEAKDRDLLTARLSFHLGDMHPIVQSLNL